jgi:hypothetical protein
MCYVTIWLIEGYILKNKMQMFVVPIHEALDTRFLEIGQGLHSGENLKRLFLLRVCFYTGNTFIAAAFPFMGDFVNLLGSFSLVPLTFMFPSMLFLKVSISVRKYKTLCRILLLRHVTNYFVYVFVSN